MDQRIERWHWVAQVLVNGPEKHPRDAELRGVLALVYQYREHLDMALARLDVAQEEAALLVIEHLSLVNASQEALIDFFARSRANARELTFHIEAFYLFGHILLYRAVEAIVWLIPPDRRRGLPINSLTRLRSRLRAPSVRALGAAELADALDRLQELIDFRDDAITHRREGIGYPGISWGGDQGPLARISHSSLDDPTSTMHSGDLIELRRRIDEFLDCGAAFIARNHPDGRVPPLGHLW